MQEIFVFKLGVPWGLVGKEGLLEEYIHGIGADVREFKCRLEDMIPHSISSRIEDYCEYFDVTATTLQKAKEMMDGFAKQFEELVKDYTSSTKKIRKYSTLVYSYLSSKPK